MFSHVTFGTNDLERAGAFYDSVLGIVGHTRSLEGETFIAYGDRSDSRFFIMRPFDGAAASLGNGCHAAFNADSRAQVDTFYAAALAGGGTDEGAPGLRSHYHADYYAAYVRDPDGNKIQATCQKPE